MRECRRCGEQIEGKFRFCPWCAAPQRLKIVDFFRAHAGIDPGKALRVSHYLGAARGERHVRFSVWDESGRAEGAVSLDEDEARRLARFVDETSTLSEAADEETVRLDRPTAALTDEPEWSQRDSNP